MPTVMITISEGRDRDAKRKLIQSVSKAVSESLKVDIKLVRVIINEIPKDNVGMNGEQVSRID